MAGRLREFLATCIRHGKQEGFMQFRLKASPIMTRTKGELKRLRREGFIPVSIQHRGDETRHYQEEAKPLEDFIRHHGEAALVSLEISSENRSETVIVHDVQRDPLSHRLLHVAFQSVKQDEPLKVHVPVTLHGTPEAVRLGTAIMQQPLETVEIRCLPRNLIEHLDVDVSQMVFGTPLRVSDVPVSDKYEILTSPDSVLVALTGIVTTSEPEGTPEVEAETPVPAEPETTESA